MSWYFENIEKIHPCVSLHIMEGVLEHPEVDIVRLFTNDVFMTVEKYNPENILWIFISILEQ